MDNQIPTEGNSSRAQSGVKKATSHMPNTKESKPFVGEGMHLGNSTPKTEPTIIPPAKGSTQGDITKTPGVGASSTLTRKGNQ